jgi:hypothetical protein
MINTQFANFQSNPSLLDTAPHALIYHTLLSPAFPLKRSMLMDETMLLIVAGTDTVSNACTISTIHILANSGAYQRLKAELHAAWPKLEDTPRFEALEALPYLVKNLRSFSKLPQSNANDFWNREQSVRSPSVCLTACLAL